MQEIRLILNCKELYTVKKLNDYFGVLGPNFSANEFWGSQTRTISIVSQYEIIGVESKLKNKATSFRYEKLTFDLAIQLSNH